MRRIAPAVAVAALEERKQSNLHVDDRLMREVANGGELFLLTLEDQESFLSLIWHEIDASRLLTPGDEPRTVRAVADRFRRDGHTFDSLSRPSGRPSKQHDPEWFARCVAIDAAFDYNRFGWLAVVPANDGERAQSPKGSFYLYDGMHKSLVLAKRLLANETLFQPVEALLMLPRRG